jgi:hypothetical protein
MPNKSEEYHENAIRCRNMADAAKSDEMKANWLLLAEKWLGMVQNNSPLSASLAAMLEDIGVEIGRPR